MIDINEKTHTSVVIGSLDKIYNQSRVTGVLHSNDIYILDSIYKLLSGCTTSITHTQRRSLISLYNTILNSSKYTCKSIILSQDKVILKSKFTQAEYTDCNTTTNLQKIYYWQEPNIDILLNDIIDNVSLNGYLQTKSFDTIPVFEIGKTISYTSIGLISFAITNSLETDNYRLYDIMNNDVTDGFTRTYLDNKTILFVSNNIYSHSDMFIKLLKSNEPLTSLKPFYISVETFTELGGIECVQSITDTPTYIIAYHSGINTEPINGDYIYNDSLGLSPHTDGYYVESFIGYYPIIRILSGIKTALPGCL